MPIFQIRKNIFLSVIASFLWMLPNFAAADYFRVGNGGEGVLLETGLFCRDLYDYDLHATAWVGSETDSLFLENIRRWNPLKLSEKDMITLAQKLTDLNHAKAFLGDDIFAAMLYFNWQPTDQNLELINPDERRRELKEEQRVALANRFLQNILVNEKGFQQLDSVNKSALIIHEAVYALMVINHRTPDSQQKQSLSATRQIVAGFYDQKNINSESFHGLINRYLFISNTAEVIPSRMGQISQDLLIVFGLSDGNQIKLMLSAEKKPDEKLRLVTNACEGFFKENNYIGSVSFRGAGTRTVSEIPYKNSNGIAQFGLAIRYLATTDDTWMVQIFDTAQCYEFFKGRLTSL